MSIAASVSVLKIGLILANSDTLAIDLLLIYADVSRSLIHSFLNIPSELSFLIWVRPDSAIPVVCRWGVWVVAFPVYILGKSSRSLVVGRFMVVGLGQNKMFCEKHC